MAGVRAAWTARLLLAALLAFSLEVVLWPQTPGRGALDRLLAGGVYVTLAAALLDLLARERVHDINGLLALAGMAALVSGLLVQPAISLQDSPLTIVTRMLGAPTAACLLALALWMALLRGRLTGWLIPAALLAGGTWGLYGRWFPSVVTPSADETALATLVVAAVVGFVVVGVVRVALRDGIAPSKDTLTEDRHGIAVPLHEHAALTEPADFRLPLMGWAVVVLVLGGVLMLRLAQGAVDGLSLAIVLVLLVFTGVILRLYRRKGAVTLLERTLPPGRLHPALLLAPVVFVAAGLVTYSLPRLDGDADPLGLLGTLLVAFGVAWLPALSLVIGIRALSRQMRAQQL